MAAKSSATTVWQGDLESGAGTTKAASGAIPEVDVSWATRIERVDGKTSPEELLAAAHASCYSMALAHGLGEAGNPPDQLTTTATVTFVPGEGVKSSELEVTGKVPGLAAAAFEEATKAAGEECPISQALKGNVEISVSATLEG
jgi:osmotically inducible protein OsmC